MKKLIALTLVLVLVFSFTSCKSASLINDIANIANGSSSGAAADSPATAYQKYSEMKSAAYDRINTIIGEHDELTLTVGMSLLPVAMVDLTLIPLTVIGIEGGAAGLAFMGMGNIKIDQNGNVYTITYTDSDNNTIKQTCEYDKNSDSMKSIISGSSEKETMVFEYTKSGVGYASQYTTLNEETGDYTLIKMYFDDSNEAAIGIETVTAAPDSIFKKSGFNADFVKNNSSYFLLKDGALTVFDKGTTTTY